MAEVANQLNQLDQLPPDHSLAASNALDDKLALAAQRVRDGIKHRESRGLPGTAAEMLRAKSERQLVQIATPTTVPINLAIERVRPEEGDKAPISPAHRNAVVPERFRDVTFASYDPQTPGQQKAMRAAMRFAEVAQQSIGPTKGVMLALIGPQGTGKSHLLYAAANALLGRGERVYARPWYRLADELRYGGESPFVSGAMEAPAIRALLWKQRIVLLDEVRATASTSFDDTELAKFACWAYDARMSVMITTNVFPLENVMGPPAASRFTQLVIDGPDWRQQ